MTYQPIENCKVDDCHKREYLAEIERLTAAIEEGAKWRRIGESELRAEIERLQDAKRRALAIADERSKENVGLRAENERLRAAAVDACALLAERTQGSPARSPGHNARLLLETAIGVGQSAEDRT